MNLTARAKIEICKVLSEEEALINKKLPKELLLRIFSYLDVISLCRCAQVSKAWNILALDGSNWQRIDLFDFQTDIEGPVVENISRRCGGFLKKLSLRGCQNVEDAALKNFAQNCNHIEELNLNVCKKLTDRYYRTASVSSSKIYDVYSFKGLGYPNKLYLSLESMVTSTCQSLSKYCPKLVYLDLGSCLQITDVSLKSIGNCQDKYSILRKLRDIEQMLAVFWKAIFLLSSLTWKKDEREGCPNLEHLNISWCDQVSKYGIEALARGCQKLQEFYSKGCPLVNDEALYELTRFCPALRVIDLHGCSNITDESVQYISQNCSKLRYLCLSNCSHLSDASLIALGQGCHFLRTLEVAGCSQFTDSGFQALAKNCHFLEKMDLEECVLITDNTLCYLAAGCPRLEKLSLSHCELITDEGIRHLGTSACSSEHLSVLELDNCPLITDASLDHLITCHSLQRIELYDCQLITRAGIRRLRNHLADLRVHAYFAPVTPPPSAGGGRPRYCRCCVIL